MTSLQNLQSNFKRHLVSGDDNILPCISSTQFLSNIDRLAIYGNAYYARLIEVLMDDYEAIHGLLGDEQFDTLCRKYIDTYPSKYFTLRWFGQYMAEYINANEPYSQHEYLYEMAKFEWMFTDAFDAEDANVITDSEVSAIPAESWPSLTVSLHPSVHWFEYHWNILPVWKAIKDNEEVPVLEELTGPETCVIWRQGLTTKYRTMEANERLLIQAAKNNMNFSEWCELLVQQGVTDHEVPAVAVGILKSWLDLGMIVGLSTEV